VRYISTLLVCALVLSAGSTRGQTLGVKPIQFESGTVFSFQLQPRLQARAGDPLNRIPSGTLLQVKMLDTARRDSEADGFPFRGTVMSSLTVGGQVIIHSEAEVQGIQILLRNKNHPEGFRYELLITDLTDQGQSYTITAFFDPTFGEANGETSPHTYAGSPEGSPTRPVVSTKPIESPSN
jgi:hypothetical protein